MHSCYIYMYIFVCACVPQHIHTIKYTVTWYPTETIEIRLILSSHWNEQWQPVKKVTVKKECRSQRGYQQMLVLSNLRSPDTRSGGREKPNDWLGPQNESGDSFPSAEIESKEGSYWKGLVADRPIAITPGEEDKNISETRGTRVLQASIKNSITSISPWKKKDSPVKPRRKIR